jgi:penicillin-binding protein 1A
VNEPRAIEASDNINSARPGLRSTAAAKHLATAIAFDGARLLPGTASLAKSVARLLKWTLIGVVLLALVGATALLWALYETPIEISVTMDAPSVVVEAANGAPLGRVGPLRDSVQRQDFPQALVDAVLSIEDRRFYAHWGVDPWGVARALRANWTAGEIVEGGSTITQQLVKMQLVGNERTLYRKLREALTALWLDFRLGKNEVLTRYLNSVYLGAGAYGMAAAARVFFDKELSELSVAESAMLAGLIRAPSKYDPLRNLDLARQRAATVVDAMVEAGSIEAKVAAKVKSDPANLVLTPKTAPSGSWFADWIARQELPKVAGPAKRPMRVRTTLQPELQEAAQRIINEALERQGAAHGVTQAALVAMRPDGAVVAMVGGRNYAESQFNRAVTALRQPGSAFKLFVYYAALRNGFAVDDIIDASPIEIGKWRPENYGGERYARMALSDAFAQSVNSAAVRLAMTVGLENVVTAARDLGLNAPLAKVPSMALGSNEVTLLNLTAAFGTVKARRKLEPWGITAFGAEGTGRRSLGAPEASTEHLLALEDLEGLLKRVVDSGTGRAARLDDGSAAGKTGTSQDYRDAWFIGFNKALVVGVWIGNDDRGPMKVVTGGSIPAEIWKQFVVAATAKLDGEAGPQAANVSETSGVKEAQPLCDRDACAAAYASFRASDCTYHSYAGRRKVCAKPGNNQKLPPHESQKSVAASSKRDLTGDEPADAEPTGLSGEGSFGGPSKGRSLSEGSSYRNRTYGPRIFQRYDERDRY